MAWTMKCHVEDHKHRGELSAEECEGAEQTDTADSIWAMFCRRGGLFQQTELADKDAIYYWSPVFTDAGENGVSGTVGSLSFERYWSYENEHWGGLVGHRNQRTPVILGALCPVLSSKI